VTVLVRILDVLSEIFVQLILVIGSAQIKNSFEKT